MDNTKFKLNGAKIYTWGMAPSRAQQVVRNGDILFSTVRPYLKNISTITELYDKNIASTGFCVIRPFLVNPKYVFNYVLTETFINSINKYAKGTSYPAVTNKVVMTQRIPLPPLQEQNRIVAKLEELFSELESSIATLKLAQSQLKAYQQKLLNQAFEGKLTEEWRKINVVIPATELLNQIHTSRKHQSELKMISWQTQVHRWKEKHKGKRPSKPKGIKDLLRLV